MGAGRLRVTWSLLVLAAARTKDEDEAASEAAKEVVPVVETATGTRKRHRRGPTQACF